MDKQKGDEVELGKAAAHDGTKEDVPTDGADGVKNEQ